MFNVSVMDPLTAFFDSNFRNNIDQISFHLLFEISMIKSFRFGLSYRLILA